MNCYAVHLPFSVPQDLSMISAHDRPKAVQHAGMSRPPDRYIRLKNPAGFIPKGKSRRVFVMLLNIIDIILLLNASLYCRGGEIILFLNFLLLSAPDCQ